VIDENRVEVSAQSGRQQALQTTVAVQTVAVPLEHGHQERHGRPLVVERGRHVPEPHGQPRRIDVGHVHFRVVRPVTFRERREHGNHVTVVGQRSEHGAHEVPSAFGRDRLDGQYSRALRSYDMTRGADQHESNRHFNRSRHDNYSGS